MKMFLMNPTSIRRRLAPVFPTPLLMLGMVFVSVAVPPATAQPAGGEWEQEGNLALNKEPARATFASFGDLDTALRILPEYSRYVHSLDGQWKFHWARQPDERPVNFYKPEFDVSGWQEIPVPSSWQCQGYGVPVYSNQRYLFKRDWPRVMGEPPENYTAFINRNPVGSYRREFQVPADWAGRDVFIHFDGVDSFFYLWINGHYIGFSKDSRSLAAFKITQHLQPGKNVVAAEVYRFSDGSYLECQDMWRLSGIFRSVSLRAPPPTRIRDFFAVPDLDANYRDGTLKITGSVVGAGAAGSRVMATLHDEAGQPVVSQEAMISDGALIAELVVTNPRQWSAETPNLYTLVLELRDTQGRTQEFVSAQTGFRKVEIKGDVFLVNGQPVKLKGVNRHENFPGVGHAVSRSQMELDLLRLKQANVNHVRTAHYPNDPYWYYLCNREGIYLLDEANIESHGYYYGKDSLSHPPEWEAAHVDRVLAMVERDKNHPCVVVWSLGNEGGPGRNFARAEQALKARDTSRPTQYERNNDIVDLGSNQYPSVGWTWNAARGARGVKYPFYISEYAHIMNNALGNLADYWEAIESSDRIMGAAIWEWCDQGLYQTNTGGEQFVAYGGDFGDAPNDGQFIVKGVVFADRTPKPCYYEVKQVYQDIAVTAVDAAKGRVEIFNKYFFKNLSGFAVDWELSEDGGVIQAGELPMPQIGPRQSVVVTVPFAKPDYRPGAEYFLTLRFRLRNDCSWAPQGHELAAGQIAIPNPQPVKPILVAAGEQLHVAESATAVTVTGGNFAARFDPPTGSLVELTYRGKDILTAGVTLNAFRCPSNNDGWVMDKWFEQGLRNLTHRAAHFTVERVGDAVRLSAMVGSRGERSERCIDFGGNRTRVEPAGRELGDRALLFHSQLTWTVYPDGSIALQTAITSTGPVLALPKIGARMELAGSLSNVVWLGRGPWENYPDRKTGAFVGQYASTVQDWFVPYARPNDMGNHEDVRWIALMDAQGDGVMFASPGAPVSVAALPYSASELLLANHPLELPESSRTVLTLDAAVLGLGGASCGPRPIERDIPESNRGYHLGLLIRPLAGGMDLSTAARVSAPLVAPVAVALRKREVVLTSPTPGAAIKYRINEGPELAATAPIPAVSGARIVAWAERAGFQPSCQTVLQLPAIADKSLYAIHYVSSQQPDEGEAAHLIDSDPDTYWHTEYGLTLSKHPHTVDIDLGEMKSFRGITYLPRQDNVNGRVMRYQFAVSDDTKTWATVAQGKFPDGTASQTVELGRTVKGRYLRFTALSEVNGRDFASAAEIGVVQ